MSSPLHFQAEGPGFEYHHPSRFVVVVFFVLFFSRHSLKNAQFLMNVVFFMLIKIKISTGRIKGYIARKNLNFKFTNVKLLIEEVFHR